VFFFYSATNGCFCPPAKLVRSLARCCQYAQLLPGGTGSYSGATAELLLNNYRCLAVASIPHTAWNAAIRHATGLVRVCAQSIDIDCRQTGCLGLR